MLMASRLSAGARWPLRILSGRVDEDDRRAARTLVGLVRRRWKTASVALLANVGAAGLEGSTMVIFAVAAQTLLGDAQAGLGDALGPVGSLAEQFVGGLGREAMFFSLILAAVATVVLRSALLFGSTTATAYIQAGVFKEVWGRIFNQVMAMTFASSSRYKAGDLNQYVWDANTMHAVFQQINLLLGNLLVLLVYLALLLWLSWPMTLAALAALVVLSLSIGGVIRRVRRSAEAFLPARVEMGNRSMELFTGLRLIHTFARQKYAGERMASSVDEAVLQTRRRTIWLGLVMPAMQSAAVVGVAVFLALGLFAVRDGGDAALARLLTFLFVLYRLLPLVGRINQGRAQLVSQRPIVLRVNDMLRTDDKEFTRDGGRRFETLRQGIELQDVYLRYEAGEMPAVDALSFGIPRGKMVALIGASGAGKSTVADLLLRLYDPGSGRILVDGEELHRLDLTQWRDRVGVVSQETFLFHASIRDNIAFGRLDATDGEIVAAARRAYAHDFISQLVDGYDTVVGDRGYRLSGGQRQRIAIARAILRDPEILVLDEATSELDSESELAIQRALDDLTAERTVLAIAHRLSTIAMADQILVLDRGRVVERGTHQELLAMDGSYARLWRIQTGPNDASRHADSAIGEPESDAKR